MARCDELAGLTEEPGRITRRYGTPALQEALDRVGRWMADAGMEVRRDAVGNLVGRVAAADGSEAPRLVLGGHLDTVRDAGRYDGVLGVLSGLAGVECLRAEGRRPPVPLEVVAFADEEGLRFHTSFFASRAYAGIPIDEQLDYADEAGITLREAIRAFGGDPDERARAARRPGELLGFVEAHIEQGPVLEREDLPVGVVSGIVGSTRGEVVIAGMAGHAGTVPMAMRRDALGAAAEVVLAVEEVGREVPGLVATVGKLEVQPGASNVIPGLVTGTLDLRHADAAVRAEAYTAIRERAVRIAARRGVRIDWRTLAGYEATPCDPALTARLREAVAAAGVRPLEIASGAGHDAVSLAAICPIAMLFVRCRDGISHNPAEAVDEADVAVAIGVLRSFVERMAARPVL